MSLQAVVNINVDFYEKKCIVINAKQLDRDSRCLLVTCYNNGVPFLVNVDDHSAYVRYKKSDGYSVFNSCQITNDGKILVVLTESMLSSEGLCNVDLLLVEKNTASINQETGNLEINKNTAILSTMTFYIDVSESVVENTEIESSYEYNALNDALITVNSLIRGLTIGGGGVGFVPQGTVTFSELKTQPKATGFVYNINEDFITDNTFVEGAGVWYGAGTNVYYTSDGYLDCLSGASVSVKGDKETSYRSGMVNLTAQNVGAIPSEDIADVNDVKNYLGINI